MSLILEALRKSEAERRRGQMPDLRAELPPAPQRRGGSLPRAWWLLPAAALLALATWWGLRERPPAAAGGTAPPPIAATTTPPPAASADLPARTPASAPAPASQPAVVPPPASGTAVEPELPPVSAPPDPVAIAQPARPAAQPAAQPPPAAPAPAGAGRVQSVGELDAGTRKALPPLRLSMHLWNAQPAQRFVIIDGQRLTEGDRVGDAVVERIDADGVLLDWNGRRLRLPLR